VHEIEETAAALGLKPDQWFPWGPGRAKVALEALDRPRRGCLVLMTAMSPSPRGVGKTTVAIALADALRQRTVASAVCLREPSMGPVFGIKGGGTGGGQARLASEEAVNLHFTGDFHAVTVAHNLLAAALDNHLHFGNDLGLDTRRLTWSRVLDLNDRALRHLVVGLGGPTGGVPREERFDITAASEVMAILAVARNPADLRERLARVVVGRTPQGRSVAARDLRVDGAMAALLREALAPNLVRTLDGSPALVHTGPFANLAHGTSSILATEAALQGADMVIQEAGFGSDLGGEKFFDLFCPQADVVPCCAVVLLTLPALRFHGGAPADRLETPDAGAVRRGLSNALVHLRLVADFGVPVVAALNHFDSDTGEETNLVRGTLAAEGHTLATVRAFQAGGAGTLDLADRVRDAVRQADPTRFRPLQLPGLGFEERLDRLVRRVYGGRGFELSARARQDLADCHRDGTDLLPVCVARTPMSLSDDPAAVGVPRDFVLRIREVRLLAGAGFLVPVCGDLMTMPGLPQHPSFEKFDG